MLVTITNVSSGLVDLAFLDDQTLKPGQSTVISRNASDLDRETDLKDLVLAGTVTISLVQEPRDAMPTGFNSSGRFDHTALLTSVSDPVITIGQTGSTILCDPTAGSFIANLPSCVGVDNIVYTMKNIGTANSVAVTPVGLEPIDGVTGGFALAIPSAATFSGPSSITIVSRSGKWWIVAKA